jgi:hypothetical protein
MDSGDLYENLELVAAAVGGPAQDLGQEKVG